MSEAIWIALIPSVLSLIGVILTVRASNKSLLADIKTEMKVNNAVQDTKIEELTREVRVHNEFAVRVPVLEEKIRQIEARSTT